MGKGEEIAPVTPHCCSSRLFRGRDDVAGQLQQRGGTARPVALVVVLGALGCSGSIPDSPLLGR